MAKNKALVAPKLDIKKPTIKNVANDAEDTGPVKVVPDPRIPLFGGRQAALDAANGISPEKEPSSEPMPKSRYRVLLKHVPPLTENPAIVVATTETEAWQEFCKINNISGSDQEKDIERIGEVDVGGTDEPSSETDGDNSGTGSDES